VTIRKKKGSERAALNQSEQREKALLMKENASFSQK
jgi:hypothetical protein